MNFWKISEYLSGVLIPLVVFSVSDRPRRSAGSVGEPSGGSPRTPLENVGQHAPPWGEENPAAVTSYVSWKASPHFDGSVTGKTLLKHKG